MRQSFFAQCDFGWVRLDSVTYGIIVKIFTKVPYMRHCHYTGGHDKERFCLEIVGEYWS